MTVETLADDGVGKRSFSDVYFVVLLLCLAAYAFTGKGFAYAGVPPIFPGEVLLLAGLATLLLPFPSAAVFCSGLHLALLLMMGWVLARTLPFVGSFGVDALRDSVIVMYGLFAFVTANLILQKPSRIGEALRHAATFFGIYGAIAALLYIFPKQLNAVIPAWPGSGAPMISLRGGEVAVHVGGALVFALLGLKRSSKLWICLLLAGIVVVSAQSRGGMLAIAVPGLLAILLSGRIAPLALTLATVIPVASLLYVADVEISLPPDQRTLRIGQVIDNAASIFVSSGDETLDGTKLWRLRWWDKIIDYTFHGEGFWSGRGFGLNLAEVDGFAGTGGEGPPLRSPHNAHMTILARTGVPGLMLWIALLLGWFAAMLRCVYVSRMSGDTEWNQAFIFVLCYLAGALVNSSFDVALEGPMIGILFWVLFGAGTGMGMAYRALRRERLRFERSSDPHN